MENRKVAYFDNSASTLIKPNIVKQQVKSALDKFTANPGRSGHAKSLAAEEQVFLARQALLNYTGGDSVIFTSSCTHALNLAILGSGKCHGHIIVTENDHNSSLRPVKYLSDNQNVSFSIAKCDENGKITAKSIEKLINDKTYLVIVNAVSNVNGDFAELYEIGNLCKKHGLLYLIDGAQIVGHEKIDYFDAGASMLAIAPHKGLYAIQGVGALVIKNGISLRPIILGGTGTSSLDLVQPLGIPEGFESGTLPTPAIISVAAGIEFVTENQKIISSTLENLTNIATTGLKEIGFDVYTKHNMGVVAFNHKKYDSSYVADYLNKFGICTRSGLHCAPLKHKALGTEKKGAVRASFSVFNDKNEVFHMLNVLEKLMNA